MEPLKIKLTYYEIKALAEYIAQASARAQHPQASLGLIILAEFRLRTEQMLHRAHNRLHTRGRPYQYSIPVSVARILHQQWQHHPIHVAQQMVLSALDYELTSRNLKPDPTQPEIF